MDKDSRRRRARLILYPVLIAGLIIIALFARHLVRTVHPDLPQHDKKERQFRISDPDSLQQFYHQMDDFTGDAVEMRDIVLVTGGSGFVCSHLVDSLLREYFQVIVFDHHLEHENRKKWVMNKGHEKIPSYVHVHGDIMNKEDLKLIPDVPIRYAIHCIGEPPPTNWTAPPVPQTEEEKSIQNTPYPLQRHVDQLDTFLNFLHEREHPISRLICFSTTDIYGQVSRRFLPFHKNTPPNPLSFWAQSKYEMETYLKRRFRKRSSKVQSVAMIRLPTVYGPRQRSHEGVVSQMIHNATLGDPIVLPVHGLYTRDLIYVTDLATIALNVLVFHKTAYLEINLGSGVETKLMDLANTIVEVTDSHSEIVTDRGFENPAITYQLTGPNDFSPEAGSLTTLADGLKATSEWVRERLSRIDPLSHEPPKEG